HGASREESCTHSKRFRGVERFQQENDALIRKTMSRLRARLGSTSSPAPASKRSPKLIYLPASLRIFFPTAGGSLSTIFLPTPSTVSRRSWRRRNVWSKR